MMVTDSIQLNNGAAEHDVRLIFRVHFVSAFTPYKNNGDGDAPEHFLLPRSISIAKKENIAKHVVLLVFLHDFAHTNVASTWHHR